jgi:hypothetical protein
MDLDLTETALPEWVHSAGIDFEPHVMLPDVSPLGVQLCTLTLR